MATSRSDLLSVTRALLRGIFILDIAMVTLLAVVLGGLMLAPWQPDLRINMDAVPPLTPEQKVFAARAAVAGAWLCCVMVMPMLRKLLAIVESARNGDPFVPENASRLRQIGWLLLASNVVLTLGISIAQQKGVAVFPVSLTAGLMVLMVFVLARIFEVGSRMRTELQETV
jgi:hypothetical protein